LLRPCGPRNDGNGQPPCFLLAKRSDPDQATHGTDPPRLRRFACNDRRPPVRSSGPQHQSAQQLPLRRTYCAATTPPISRRRAGPPVDSEIGLTKSARRRIVMDPRQNAPARVSSHKPTARHRVRFSTGTSTYTCVYPQLNCTAHHPHRRCSQRCPVRSWDAAQVANNTEPSALRTLDRCAPCDDWLQDQPRRTESSHDPDIAPSAEISIRKDTERRTTTCTERATRLAPKLVPDDISTVDRRFASSRRIGKAAP